MNKEVPEHVQNLLREVITHFDKEDRAVRERQIRVWKKLKYFWNGFTRLWYSEVAHDWRIPEQAYGYDDESGFYDKQVNVFRAYLESIIAALSVSVPGITCAPDDADSPLDLSTAKAGDKIAELIFKHNDAPLLWLHALYIYCTEGMVAGYNYTKEDEKYGLYTTPKTEDEEVETDTKVCPNCQTPLQDDGSAERMSDQERVEYGPDDDDIVAHDLLNQHEYICPQCLIAVDPEIVKERMIVTRIVGETNKPKSRQCIEVYGGLFVKVANYAMRQCDTPYLIFAYETHYSFAVDRYPHLRNKFGGNSKVGSSGGGMYDPYERWGRLSTQYLGEYPINTCTIRNCWLRPESFNVLNDEEDVKLLKKHYPDGAKCVMVNDQYAESCNESLDDSWTLTYNPLSDYIYYDPLGMLLTGIQEMTGEMISLVLQTIEHGIPQTFADPQVLNFDQYRQTEATPGMIFPAKPKSGGSIGDGFYEVKTATLSGEILPFMEKIQEAGQLVSGALPSLFGGASPSNSGKTAAQYAMSRAQALQRLQTPWKMLTYWWKGIFGKVIPAYIKELAEDEKIVEKDELGNYINVWIRKAQLQGKIGSVELEANEQLPITWSQKKDVVMQLLQAGNPQVMAALSAPENIPILAAAIGLDDFNLPGQDDRNKQYEEIRLLLDSEPINNGMMEVPSVSVEYLVDNHPIEADICRHFLVSDAGRLAKVENQKGYRNILLHMQQHIQAHTALTAMSAPPQEQPNDKSKPAVAPLTKGKSNAAGSATVQ